MYEVYVLVEKKKSLALKIFLGLCYIISILSVIFTIIGGYLFVLVALVCLLITWFLQTRNYEFEYSYFDGDIRFAKIINKANRKKLPGYNMSEVVMIAPAGDASVERYEKNPNARVRKLQSGFPDREVFVMVTNEGPELELVYFEPDQKYLDAVCVKYGYKVRR